MMIQEVFVDQEILEVIAARASMPSERMPLRDEVPGEEGRNSAMQARLEHLYDLVEATDDEQIERFIAQYHLDQEQIEHFLSTPQRLAGPLPSWIRVLEQVVRQEVSRSSQDTGLASHDPSLLAESPLPFEIVLLPFLRYARQQYKQQTTHLPSLLTDKAQISLERWLLRQLCDLSGETLLFEFSLFRQQHASEVFSSESQTLYERFVAQLRGEGLLSFFQEYSLLARFLVLKVEQWVNNCTEFVHRLATDLDELGKMFHEGVSVGSVVEVQAGCSDAHHQGRTVFLVTFADGLKLVYKLRSLAVDQAFANLLLWGNERGLSPSLKPIRVLNRETHGWAEYVAQQSCSRSLQSWTVPGDGWHWLPIAQSGLP